MKRLHIWLSTLYYNWVARMWKRWQEKHGALPADPTVYRTAGDYVNEAAARLKAYGYEPPPITPESQEFALREVNAMMDKWALRRLWDSGTPIGPEGIWCEPCRRWFGDDEPRCSHIVAAESRNFAPNDFSSDPWGDPRE